MCRCAHSTTSCRCSPIPHVVPEPPCYCGPLFDVPQKTFLLYRNHRLTRACLSATTTGEPRNSISHPKPSPTSYHPLSTRRCRLPWKQPCTGSSTLSLRMPKLHSHGPIPHRCCEETLVSRRTFSGPSSGSPMWFRSGATVRLTSSLTLGLSAQVPPRSGTPRSG